MAISVKELIEQKEKIEGNKKVLDDIETSVVEPNLKDKDLQKAYNCIEPTDIVGKLFKAGEIGNIATAIMKCAGYESLEAKVHEEIKN